MTKLVEFARKLLHANLDNISLNPTTPALEFVLRTPTSMRTFVLLPVSQDTTTMELEDVLPLLLRPDAHSLTSSAMEFVSATVLQEPTLILRTEFVNHAHPTASVVLPTLSVMLVMLDMISAKEFVLLPLFNALLVNSDTMESATQLALLELVNKEASVRELVPLELGLIMVDVTELVQPNSLLLMPVLTHAQLELL